MCTGARAYVAISCSVLAPSGDFPGCPETFPRVRRNFFRMSKNFPEHLEKFQSIQKLSKVSGNFPEYPETFQNIQKLSRVSRIFPVCPETFQNIRKLPRVSENFPCSWKLSLVFGKCQNCAIKNQYLVKKVSLSCKTFWITKLF